MSNKSAQKAPVSHFQGVNVAAALPDVAEQQNVDTANEAAEKQEKAILAAIPTAKKFLESLAQFNLWLKEESTVREEAYKRAREETIKVVTNDKQAKATELRKQLEALNNEIASAEKDFETPAIAPTKPVKTSSGKGRPKGSTSEGKTAFPFDDTAVLAKLTDSPQSIKVIAKALGTEDKKGLALVLKTLIKAGKVGAIGQKAGKQYLTA